MVAVIHGASGLDIHDTIPLSHSMCDGQWHVINIRIMQKIVEISVDEVLIYSKYYVPN